MKYIILLTFATIFLSTCGMLSHYNLIECLETQELTCETMKTFNSMELCEKFAKELNQDSVTNLYYCDEAGPFQK